MVRVGTRVWAEVGFGPHHTSAPGENSTLAPQHPTAPQHLSNPAPQQPNDSILPSTILITPTKNAPKTRQNYSQAEIEFVCVERVNEYTELPR